MIAYYLGETLDMKLLVTVSFSYFQYIWERTFSLPSLHMQYIFTYLCNSLEMKDNIGLMSSSHELVMEFRTFLFRDRL